MASRTLSGPKISLRLTGSVVNTMDDGTTATAPHPTVSYSKTLTNGVSANQANRGWQSIGRTLASGHQETIDLYDFIGLDIGAGAGNDGVGQALAIEEIVAIAITNDNEVDAAGRLEVLPAVGEGWSPIGTHTVATGGALDGQGILFKANVSELGFDVAGSNHRITMRASGGSVTYSIYLFGRHDDNESSSSSLSSSSSSSVSSVSSSGSSLSSMSSSKSSLSSISVSMSSISTSGSSSSSSSSGSSSSSFSSVSSSSSSSTSEVSSSSSSSSSSSESSSSPSS